MRSGDVMKIIKVRYKNVIWNADFDRNLHENVNFSDFNSYAADACKRYITDTVQLAKKLDVPIINMHFHRGEHFTLPDRKVDLYAVYREQYIRSVYAFRDMCENAIGESDINICIENCW